MQSRDAVLGALQSNIHMYTLICHNEDGLAEPTPEAQLILTCAVLPV